MLLKQNDKHLSVNIYHISYTMQHFSDVLELNSLKADFEYALAYMQSLKQISLLTLRNHKLIGQIFLYPGLPINCASFSVEQNF